MPVPESNKTTTPILPRTSESETSNRMSKETKFGYGFLLVGTGMPYLIEHLFGLTWAIVASVGFVVIGSFFLFSGHRHKDGEIKRLSKWEWIALGASAVTFIILCYIGALRLSEKRETKQEHIETKQNFRQLEPPPFPSSMYDAKVSDWTIRNQPNSMTLRDLFLVDHMNYMQHSYQDVAVDDARNIKATVGLVYDLQQRTKYLTFYVPPQEKYTKETCEWLLQNYREIMKRADLVNLHTKYTGDSNTMNTEDAIFSRTVYIYHETYLPMEASLAIQQTGSRHGLNVTLRSLDYFSAHQTEAIQTKKFREKEN